jgi:HPt (histidine-containing phosphotransfer) domain-containing protein
MRIDSRRFSLAMFALMSGVAALTATAAQADDKPEQKAKVFVFAQKDASGFVDQRTQDLQATVKDIREAITKKKRDWVQLVEAREQADIVLEVTERTLVERQGTLSTNTTYDKDGKRATSTTTQSQEHDVVLKAVMSVGDYKNELTGQCDLGYLFGGAYRQAAKNLVGSLENWVKQNYTSLQMK